MNNKLDHITEIRGEYNLSVFHGIDKLYTTGWCTNTILSGGLVNLYNSNVIDLINRLDFGLSTSLPGTDGYGLSSVISPASGVLVNIQPNAQNTFIQDLSTQVYYSRFQTPLLTSNISLNEFCVKSQTTGFSRNVFIEPIFVERDQYIIFEYRLNACRSITYNSNIPFSTPSNRTFNIPVSSVIFNVPYPEIYRPGSQLILLQNTETLPNQYNILWPDQQVYSVVNEAFSTFKSTEIGRGINNDTKSYTVSTAFYNVSAAPVGIFNQISTILLQRPTGNYNNIVYPFNSFVATRLKFPLTLYKYPSEFFQSFDSTYYSGSTSLIKEDGIYNAFDLFYNFTWRETTH